MLWLSNNTVINFTMEHTDITWIGRNTKANWSEKERNYCKNTHSGSWGLIPHFLKSVNGETLFNRNAILGSSFLIKCAKIMCILFISFLYYESLRHLIVNMDRVSNTRN